MLLPPRHIPANSIYNEKWHLASSQVLRTILRDYPMIMRIIEFELYRIVETVHTPLDASMVVVS